MRFALSFAGLCLVLLASTPVFAEGKVLTWAGCGISKNAFMQEMAAAYEKKTGVKIDLKGGGATKGIRDVATKTVNVGGTCRHTLQDTNTVSGVHVEERRVQLTPVAWDALVVIVHKDNPVNNLTIAQIRKLYTGKIRNWKELGGRDAPVELYARKGKISGVGRMIRELIFNNYDQEFVARHVVNDSAKLEKTMVENPNGVGMTGVSSARKLGGIAKILSLEGKEPSYGNIRDGHYLLYRPLYMVSNLEEKDAEVRKFIQFVYSEEGKQIMRSVGTVPYEDAIGLWMTYLDQQKKATVARIGL